MPIHVMSVADIYDLAETRVIKLLILGSPGSGKTLLASTAPEPLYIDMEGRLLSIRDRKHCRRVRVTTLQQLEEVKAALDQRKEVRQRLLGPVQTVVLDTVDELSRIIIKERLQAEQQESMRQADWGYLGDTMRDILRSFRNIADLNVIFNCHIRTVSDEDTGRTWQKPDIQGSVGNEIAAYTDEVLLLKAVPVVDPKTGERVVTRHLQTYPDKAFDFLKDHSGTLPMEFPVNFTDDFERMSALIFGTAPEAPPAAPMTVEPVTAQPAPEPEPAPAPEPAPPEPVDTPPSHTEEPAPTPTPAPDTEPSSETVPVKETEMPTNGDEAPGAPAAEEARSYTCAECGQDIDNPDIAEVAKIRYGVYLCRADFQARRAAKTS